MTPSPARYKTKPRGKEVRDIRKGKMEFWAEMQELHRRVTQSLLEDGGIIFLRTKYTYLLKLVWYRGGAVL